MPLLTTLKNKKINKKVKGVNKKLPQAFIKLNTSINIIKDIKYIMTSILPHSWQTEANYIQYKNNMQFLLLSPTINAFIYNKHIQTIYNFRNIKKGRLKSWLLWSLTTGNLGFSTDTKKSFVASKSILTFSFWFLRIYSHICTPVFFKFISKSRNLRSFIRECQHFLKLSNKKSNIYGVHLNAPSRFGHQYLKHYTRKRYRYHLAKTYKLHTFNYLC